MCGKAYASIQAGLDADDRSKAQARMLRLQAKDARERGMSEATEARRQGRIVRGAQQARHAAMGLEVDSGSAADLAYDTGSMSERDALTIRNNAVREAWGYNQQARFVRYEGRLAKRAGWQAGWSSAVGGTLSAIFSMPGGSSTPSGPQGGGSSASGSAGGMSAYSTGRTKTYGQGPNP